jgi:hypothetical protein
MKRFLLLVPLAFVDCAGLQIARSLSDKNLASKPAQAMATSPRDADDSYAVDIGAGYTRPILFRGSQVDLTFGGEYHRTTLVDKEQDALLLLVRADQQYGDLAETGWSFFPGIALKAKNDEVAGTRSILPTIDFTLASKVLHIGDIISIGPSAFEWQPTLGVEGDYVIEAPSDIPTGQIGRAWTKLDLVVYPFWDRWRRRLEVAGHVAYWQDFAETTALDTGRDQHYLRTVGITYYFDPERRFAIGATRVSGENPTEAQPEQHYDQVSFKVRIR